MVIVSNSTITNTDPRLVPGREFTVKGKGRYRVVRLRLNGEVNAWGPIDSKGSTNHAGMHTFRPEAITLIHRKVRAA